MALTLAGDRRFRAWDHPVGDRSIDRAADTRRQRFRQAARPVGLDRLPLVHTAILTREFPPDVYGGAGVHVEYLVRELRKLIDVDVHCFGDDRPGAVGHRPAPDLAGANAALTTLSVDLSMVAATGNVELLHSHTWYANMAGHIGKLLHGVPHVVTAHSLEPHRPWKAEQLGGGYRLSVLGGEDRLRGRPTPSSRCPPG